MKLASLWSNHFSTAPSSWAFWGFNIWAFGGYHTFNAWDFGGYPRQNNQESIIFEPTSRSLDINSKNSRYKNGTIWVSFYQRKLNLIWKQTR
jgi:hypothetical protein